MKSSLILSLGIFAASVATQDVFEPTDFNITEALLGNGVNVAALPELANLEFEKRSPFSPCSAAVCHPARLYDTC
jgi:hypothetical protein